MLSSFSDKEGIHAVGSHPHLPHVLEDESEVCVLLSVVVSVGAIRVNFFDHEGCEVLFFNREVGERMGNKLLIHSWNIFCNWKECWCETGLDVAVMVLQGQVRQGEDVEQLLGNDDLESLQVRIQVRQTKFNSLISKCDNSFQIVILECDRVDDHISQGKFFDVDRHIESVIWNINCKIEMILDNVNVNGQIFLTRCSLNPKLDTDGPIKGHSAITFSNGKVANFVELVLKVDQFVFSVFFYKARDE